MVESSFDEIERKTLKRCLGVIERFEIRDGEYLPMKLAKTFVHVALSEGEDLVTICRLTGETNSTMSRHLRKLGDGAKGTRGFYLIESPPSAIYVPIYKLSSKGRRFAKGIIAALEKS